MVGWLSVSKVCGGSYFQFLTDSSETCVINAKIILIFYMWLVLSAELYALRHNYVCVAGVQHPTKI